MNLVTDTLPALALTLEPAEPDVMRRPPRDPEAAILSRRFVLRICFYSLLIAASTLAAFAWGLAHDPRAAGTMAFMTLTLAQIFHLGNARSSRTVVSPSAAVSNRYALAALFLSLLLQVAVVSFQPLALMLGVAPLPPGAWLVVVGCSAATAVVGQTLHAWRSR